MQSTIEGAACPFHAGSVAGQGKSAPAVSRRTLLGGLLGAAAVQWVGSCALAPVRALAARKRAAKSTHGVVLRGLDIAVKQGRSREARFGLLFKQLAAYSPPDALLKTLAGRMNDQLPPLSDVRDSDPALDTAQPAGYVYLGQFIDHDMTRDTTPLSRQRQDVSAMTNYDTPRFDLGSVYGNGPVDSPELYDPARPGYLLVNTHDGLADLPRDEVGAAYLGDPRNDENLVVAQLHTVFLRLHNMFRDQGKTFEQAQKQCRWHYQWVILHDYLPRIVGQAMIDSILVKKGKSVAYAPRFYRPRNVAKPYMPVEYSGAAFRFGHSMIRAEYEMQDGHTVPIFAPDGYEDLRGNRRIPADMWADWNYFFDIPGVNPPDDRNFARRIDTFVSMPLATLPSTVVADTTGTIRALSERNLLRGKRLGLPAGQDVAATMGLTPLTNAQLGLTGAGWKNKAPLWFYILKEAELLADGQILGPVGGRIVAEVIIGLLALDKTCYLNARPGFNPGAGFAMGDLILLAGAFDPRGLEIEDAEADEEPDGEELELEPLDPGEEIDPEATDPLPTDL